MNEQFKSTIVGGLGNDHIFAEYSAALLLYGSDPSSGSYGNDTISLFYATASTAYGGQGNDRIFSDKGTGNTFYVGDANDTISAEFSTAEVLYGNQGNDSFFDNYAFALTWYGGQGDDTVVQEFSAGSVLYGNKGNDLVGELFAPGAQGNSVLYGGAGDDTLAVYAAGAIRCSAAPGTICSPGMTRSPTPSSLSTP